jgi:hypothetical protein
VSEHVRVAKGKALALLPAQVGQIEWRSTLKEQPQIVLASAKQLAWVEVWRFDVGPQWHVEFSGIPVVHHQSEGRWLPEWRPWPGEELKAQIARPEGIAGRTLTIDRTELSVTPGIRATDATLSLAMRSSRGGEHTIKLPEGAELLSAAIDGKSQPLRLEGDALRIPIVPGAQTVKLGWREARGIGAYFAAAPVVAGASGVNAWTKLNVSPDRWVLWVRGPRVGPAILLWGVVLALIPIAIGLSRVRLTPLSARDWFLLSLGLTQSPIAIGIFIVIWLFALGLRGKRGEVLGNRMFDFVQIVLGIMTVAAGALLLVSVKQSLLGYPEMQIVGNGSDSRTLNWYQDRSADILPGVSILSLPLFFYRLLMLAWALWLAISLLKWLKWGWECFSAGGYWRRLELIKPGETPSKAV